MASRIPENIVDEVLSRVSIVDVIGEHVRLKRNGSRFVGLCPFHGEKSPSFSVNAERNLFHCFGCGASGNTVGFVMRHDGLSFPEAIRSLADKAGVVIPDAREVDGRDKAWAEGRERYFAVTERAQRFYRAALESGRWAPPADYLKTRGIDADTSAAFGLGYAPPEWSALVDALGRDGIPSAWVEEAGLASPRSRGDGHVDRFRDRVMFPIVALSKKVLAFSGRTLDPEERAKYVNSPETQYYVKGKELFGLHLAHQAIKAAGEAVLVEGNFDVVSLHARGIRNVCAPLGTALTEAQVRLLKRYTERVVLMFDGDAAGEKAAHRALEALLQAGIKDIVWARLPQGSDPDDMARKEGADAVRRTIGEARPMLDQLFDAWVAPVAGRVELGAKQRALRGIAGLLRAIPDAPLREQYARDVAARLEVEVAAVMSAPPAAGQGADRFGRDDDAPVRVDDGRVDDPQDAYDEPVAPFTVAEATLLELLVDEESFLDRFVREELHHLVPSAQLAAFLRRAAEDRVDNGGPPLRAAIEAEPYEPLRRALTAALVEDRGLLAALRARAFEDTVSGLKREFAVSELRRVQEALRQPQSEEEVLRLLSRSTELSRLLADVDASRRARG